MSTVNQTFIIQPLFLTGESATYTAATGVYTNQLVSVDGNSNIQMGTGTTTFNTHIMASGDNTVNLGSVVKRFRTINTVSGTTSVWSVSTTLNSPNLNLGLDSDGLTRIITANNSIIQEDAIIGGDY